MGVTGLTDDYASLLEQLKDGTIDELKVTPTDFMTFQIAYMAFESRKRVIGTAEKNGTIIYHYDHEQTA